jgi:hypothetical protein
MLLMTAALALNLFGANPALAEAEFDHVVRDYRGILAGRIQLDHLPPQERLEIMQLADWDRSYQGIRPSETTQQCKKRLASPSASRLEEAVPDLKCSQRPAG